MNKVTFPICLILTLVLTACGNAANATSSASGGPGELSQPVQVAIGTIKLDGTANAITKDQAAELLPLWETLQVLENSDTAASEEKEALRSQIQETMTGDQIQAIAALSLTRQDMFALMQSQGGVTFGGTQNNNAQSSSSSSSGRSFNPGGDFPGGPPPDGGFPGGGRSSQSSSSTQSTNSTQSSNQQLTSDPNRVPTPLLQAIIEYLKTKAGP